MANISLKHRLSLIAVAFLPLLLLLTGLALAAAPPLPHSLYGTVTLDGSDAPAGTTLTAWISGTAYATATTFLAPTGRVVYQLHLPGNNPDTPGREGGQPGDPITFQVGGHPAINTTPWQSGQHQHLNLVAFSTPQPPSASFSHTPTTPFVGETTTFTDTSSDIDSPIVAWGWEFGDGSRATGPSAHHAYASHGTFTPTLTITDSDGLTATATATVRVLALPTANFSYSPAAPRAGDPIQFTDLSNDPDGNLITWAWQFGDGGSSPLPNPQHSYATPGDYFVTLTVTDNDGSTNFLTRQIRVYGPAVASFTYNPNPALANAPVQFSDTSNSTAGPIVAWAWDFDDGSRSSLQNPQHTYQNSLGRFIVTLTVTDSLGYSGSASQAVTVTVPPSASFTYTPTQPANNQPVQFTNTSSHADPTASITAWAWDFGDGSRSSQPNPSHAFSTGRVTITLTITDSHGLSSRATSQLTANDPPVANAGGPYNGSEGSNIPLNAAASYDPDGTLAAFAWDLDNDGQYDDASGIAALVSFADNGTYPVGLRVTDNLGGSATSSTTVNVNNVAPSVNAGPDQTTTLSQTVSLPPAGFTDPGLADSHTFSVTWGNGSLINGTVGHVNGSGTITGSTIFYTTGTYTPTVCVQDDDGDRGCDSFNLTVNLPDLLQATKRATLHNDADNNGLISPGDTLRYTIIITNHGSINASGIIFSDTLDSIVTTPAGSVTTSQGTILSGNNAGDSRVIINLGNLPPAGVATITFHVTILTPLPAGIDTTTNQATLWGSNFQTTPSDDPTTPATPDPTLTPIIATPDLALTTTDLRTTAAPGQLLIYRLTLTNTGQQAASGIILTATLPAHTSFAGADYGGAPYGSPPASRVISWSIPSLAGGDSLVRTLIARVNSPLPAGATTITHTAHVHEDGTNGPDPAGNNHASDSNTLNLNPDLAHITPNPAGLTTDPQSLALSGSASVSLRNSGSLTITTPFSLTLFEDRDHNGQYNPTSDNPLGHTLVTGSLAPAGVITLPVPLSGTTTFRHNHILAYADAGDLIAELNENNNLGSTAQVCTILPPTNNLSVTVQLNWPPAGEPLTNYSTSRNSLSTPLVVQVSDDNNDGQINNADTPDIIFVSFAWGYGCGENSCGWFDATYVLRAISGDDGHELFSVRTPGYTYARSGLAAGDIDGDGIVEILTTDQTESPNPNHVLAYEHDGTLKWVSPGFYAQPANSGTDRSHPYLADLDSDGTPEIIVASTVLNADGSLRWRGSLGMAWQAINNFQPGDLFSSRSGALSTVADLNLDGSPEIVTGRTAYHADGSIYWHLASLDDGYPAIGNFNDDAFPEIVVASRGYLRLHDHTGSLIWGPIPLPGSDPEPGGPPTIADFDGDGQPEIGLAGSNRYVVYETDGSLKWQSNSQDESSGMTGSTLFDLDGDGTYELIYRDEQYLRIYQGSDGAILYQLELSSATVNESPIVADVDSDGQAEIIVSSDELRNRDGSWIRTQGIRVLGSATGRWAWTRAIWNQHAYHVSNVNPNGTIPTQTDWFWLDHNTYRTNLDPNVSPYAAPDATLGYLRLDSSSYPTLAFTARVGNGGAAPLAAGLPIAFYNGNPAGGGTLLGLAHTSQVLQPGHYQDVTFHHTSLVTTPGEIWAVVDDDGQGRGRYDECREDNNQHSLAYDLADIGLATLIDDGLAALNAGDPTTYTLTLVNARPVTLTGLLVTATLPTHTFFGSASGGGSHNGSGQVTWPSFSLPPHSYTTRTLAIQVDPAIPLAVRHITATASLTDDGSHGPDPSPANNSATDHNTVLTVDAQAGGPYSAPEGGTILLNGSSSSDRDGSIVRYEWDLDGDGLFDDATGITATLTYSDNLAILAGLRVTDDSGEQDSQHTPLTFLNLPAGVIAGSLPITTEGSLLNLAPATFTDPGRADTHTATVNWGDGQTITATVNELNGSGSVIASHAYADNGLYPVTICVTDDDGATGCDSLPATINNAPPQVALGELDLYNWAVEDLGPAGSSNWNIVNDTRVDQTINNGPTFFYSPFPAYGSRLQARIRGLSNGDNDFFGLVLGFQPGDTTNPNADYLIIDWKKSNQSYNFGTPCGSQYGAGGIGIIRVRGIPLGPELWAHQTLACNPDPQHSVTELARGLTRGSSGWAYGTYYDFTVDYSDTHLRVWVNDILEIDLHGSFPAGRIGFYNYSQANVQYTNLALANLAGFEGGTVNLAAPFGDQGLLDTHTATVDWDDGQVSSATVAQLFGGGIFSSTHIYQDNALYTITGCVTDDDGGTGCDLITADVANLPPQVNAGPDHELLLNEPLTLTLATFFDPGALDTHSAAISWGDGLTNTGSISYTAGSPRGISGTLNFPSHTFTRTGILTATLCVTDDDTGRGCDALSINVTTILVNIGDAPAGFEGSPISFTGSYTDPLASSSYTITWDFGDGTQASSSLTPTHTYVEDGHYPVTLIVENDAGLTGRAQTNVTISNVAPQVNAGPDTVLTEGQSLSLPPAGFSDPGLTDSHTATIDWGDGTIEAGLVTEAGGSGSVAGSHLYPDNAPGSAPHTVRICVTDDEGDTGCDELTVQVNNAPPLVTPALHNIHTWVQVNHNGTTPNWSIAADGRSVRQLANNGPSTLLDPESSAGVRIEGIVTPGSDNDRFGFAFGIRPGDETNPTANYLLVDWKQTNQSYNGPCGSGMAARGLALSRVSGTPAGDEFWIHANRSCTPPESGLELLALGLTRGSSGYGSSHTFTFDYLPGRLRVWVDGTLEFDYLGDVPAGNFGFFTHAQPTVTFQNFTITRLVADEGQPLNLFTRFTDPGLVDTHSGSINWADGTIISGTISQEAGGGTLTASHTYPDNALFPLLTCVMDDDGGQGCLTLTATIANVAPLVTATLNQDVPYGQPFSLPLASYSDPGRLDTHTALIDWGDGSVITRSLASPLSPLTGTITATHTYTATGLYLVTITVIDDDGGVGQDTMELNAILDPTAITLHHVNVGADTAPRPGDRYWLLLLLPLLLTTLHLTRQPNWARHPAGAAPATPTHTAAAQTASQAPPGQQPVPGTVTGGQGCFLLVAFMGYQRPVATLRRAGAVYDLAVEVAALLPGHQPTAVQDVDGG